ncbi:MAG: deaminase, partial [Candidatus Omnitrophica bacterium]|nr:deaminase [Candidatus Omnitrophota bacterium]
EEIFKILVESLKADAKVETGEWSDRVVKKGYLKDTQFVEVLRNSIARNDKEIVLGQFWNTAEFVEVKEAYLDLNGRDEAKAKEEIFKILVESLRVVEKEEVEKWRYFVLGEGYLRSVLSEEIMCLSGIIARMESRIKEKEDELNTEWEKADGEYLEIIKNSLAEKIVLKALLEERIKEFVDTQALADNPTLAESLYDVYGRDKDKAKAGLFKTIVDKNQERSRRFISKNLNKKIEGLFAGEGFVGNLRKAIEENDAAIVLAGIWGEETFNGLQEALLDIHDRDEDKAKAELFGKIVDKNQERSRRFISKNLNKKIEGLFAGEGFVGNLRKAIEENDAAIVLAGIWGEETFNGLQEALLDIHDRDEDKAKAELFGKIVDKNQERSRRFISKNLNKKIEGLFAGEGFVGNLRKAIEENDAAIVLAGIWGEETFNGLQEAVLDVNDRNEVKAKEEIFKYLVDSFKAIEKEMAKSKKDGGDRNSQSFSQSFVDNLALQAVALADQSPVPADGLKVAAIIFDKNGEIIGTGIRTQKKGIATFTHAEKNAIRDAESRGIKNWSEYIIAVTMEPCGSCCRWIADRGFRACIICSLDGNLHAFGQGIACFKECDIDVYKASAELDKEARGFWPQFSFSVMLSEFKSMPLQLSDKLVLTVGFIVYRLFNSVMLDLLNPARKLYKISLPDVLRLIKNAYSSKLSEVRLPYAVYKLFRDYYKIEVLVVNADKVSSIPEDVQTQCAVQNEIWIDCSMREVYTVVVVGEASAREKVKKYLTNETTYDIFELVLNKGMYIHPVRIRRISEESKDILRQNLFSEMDGGEEILSSDGKLAAMILNIAKIVSGNEGRFIPLTQENLSVQMAINRGKAGDKGKTVHYHTPAPGQSEPRWELMYVLEGRIKALVYTLEGELIEERTLNKGELILFSLAHNIEFLEDSVLLEFKQGPYPGLEQDKVVLDAKDGGSKKWNSLLSFWKLRKQVVGLIGDEKLSFKGRINGDWQERFICGLWEFSGEFKVVKSILLTSILVGLLGYIPMVSILSWINHEFFYLGSYGDPWVLFFFLPFGIPTILYFGLLAVVWLGKTVYTISNSRSYRFFHYLLDYLFLNEKEEYLLLINKFIEKKIPLSEMLEFGIPIMSDTVKQFNNKEEASQLTVNLVISLIDNGIRPCSTIVYGVPLAAKTSDGDLDLFRQNIKVLEEMALDLNKNNINPFETLMKGKKIILNHGFGKSGEFRSSIQVAALVPLLEKKRRDLGLSDSMMSDFTNWLINNAKSLNILQELLLIELEFVGAKQEIIKGMRSVIVRYEEVVASSVGPECANCPAISGYRCLCPYNGACQDPDNYHTERIPIYDDEEYVVMKRYIPVLFNFKEYILSITPLNMDGKLEELKIMVKKDLSDSDWIGAVAKESSSQ